MVSCCPLYCNHQEGANSAVPISFIDIQLLQLLYRPSSDSNVIVIVITQALELLMFPDWTISALDFCTYANDFGQNMEGLLRYIAKKHRMAISI